VVRGVVEVAPKIRLEVKGKVDLGEFQPSPGAMDAERLQEATAADVGFLVAYPLDVLGGWILGGLLGWCCWLAWKRLAPRLKMAVLPDELYRPLLPPQPGCR